MVLAAAIVVAAAVAVEVDHHCGGPLDTGTVAAAAVGDTDAPGEDPSDVAAPVVAAVA